MQVLSPRAILLDASKVIRRVSEAYVADSHSTGSTVEVGGCVWCKGGAGAPHHHRGCPKLRHLASKMVGEDFLEIREQENVKDSSNKTTQPQNLTRKVLRARKKGVTFA